MEKKSGYILGLSCFYHDSAACLLKDGELIAAASEERFTRKKQDEDFPKEAVKYCLEEAGINIDDVDYVCFYEKPILKFERLLQTYIKTWPRGFQSFLKAMRTWLGKKLWVNNIIKKELGWKGEVCYVPHHLSHAASAYYPSSFNNAVVLTIDGVGEWSTATIGKGEGHKLEISEEIVFPHSVGLLYSAFTYYLGFKVNSAEYKVMGLAPYGEPKYVDKIKEIVKIFDDGSIELDMKYFSYEHGLTMTNKKLDKFFGKKRRKESESLEQFHKDMARSLQAVTEEIVLKMVRYAHRKYGSKNICLAGGVALNCVANGRILRESEFQDLFVFPAAGDSGAAVGCAYFLHHHILNNEERHSLKTIYLGPEYSDNEIEKLLNESEIKFDKISDKERSKKIAKLIDENNVIGLFQGRMEFGPRALGNRSILADPRKKENWQRVNLKIKFRESFRPFAPSVMVEHLASVFEIEKETPYMLLTAQTKVKDLPAITHVDGSARIQSVSREQNKKYHEIIEEFYNLTKCPVVINTSFNVRGEPIVCSPLDALKCFIRTEMDVLVLEDYFIYADKVDKKALAEKFTLEIFEKD